MKKYTEEVRMAVKRVGTIFANECDRCELSDLVLLESVGLMEKDICDNSSDTLEIGDTAWFFTEEGDSLVDATLGA